MNRFMRLVRGIPGQGVPASGEAAAVQDDHHDEQGTGSTYDEYKKVTRFFSVYFVVITLILLWNLFHFFLVLYLLYNIYPFQLA